MRRIRRFTRGKGLATVGAAVVGALHLALGPMPARADAAGLAGRPLPVVWREQHVYFYYRGRTVRYSCDGLRDKLRAMLLDLGARRDLNIAAIGCQGAAGVPVNAAGPSLHLLFFAPGWADTSAQPEHIGELPATDARFEPFSITTDAFRNMGVGDCELVEEFARQVLPRLVTRDVRQDITCVPSGQGGSRFLVRGEILKASPRAEQGLDPSTLKER